MRKIITALDKFRIKKFLDRGWSIDDAVFEPVIHQSLKTSYHFLTDPEL